MSEICRKMSENVVVNCWGAFVISYFIISCLSDVHVLHVFCMTHIKFQVKQESKTSTMFPTYQRSRILYPAPLIPYHSYDMEIKLTSLDDPTPSPQPSPPQLLPPISGFDYEVDVGGPASVVSESASQSLPSPQRVNALKEIISMDIEGPASGDIEIVGGVYQRSDAATSALLNFDEEFPLATLCDNYKDLDFSVCSPAFSTVSENGGHDLHDLGLANATASSLFMMPGVNGGSDEMNTGDASWTPQGVVLTEAEEENEEENE